MGDGLLSGLDSFGLGNLEGMDLFEEKKKEEAKAAPVVTEQDFLLDKTTKCPLCDTEFKAKVVKGSKAKLVGTDMDLRPKYEQLDVLKYDVIMCPHCGYTALTRYFPTLMDSQAKKIREKITASFKPQVDRREIYTYDDAVERYKLALVNAIVKGAKASEKAYICLKTSWVLRGKAEEVVESSPEYQKTKAMERDFSKNAYEGFMNAIQAESFPMCGMDEITVDYLLAVLSVQFEQYDMASRCIAKILQSPQANPRMKDKVRTLKEDVLKKLKAKG